MNSLRTLLGSSLAKIIRLVNAVVSLRSPFIRAFPAGHFYSPLPDISKIRSDREQLFNRTTQDCPAVDLRREAQLEMIDCISRYYHDFPLVERPSPGARFYLDNTFFRHADAIVLFGIMRHFRPRRVVEIGGGFSTALMLDTIERHDLETELVVIEPHPARLKNLLGQSSRSSIRLVTESVQDIDLQIFQTLGENDVLFVDSSHVVKIGSDVGHIIFSVLPALKAGVLVHFHDVMWPFEYPENWIVEGRAWNEAYMLRAFLQYNHIYQIELFNSYAGTILRDIVAERMPQFLKDTGGSLWLRKQRDQY